MARGQLNKTRLVGVRMSLADAQGLRHQALECGLTLSERIRRRIAGQIVISRTDRETASSIDRLGRTTPHGSQTIGCFVRRCINVGTPYDPHGSPHGMEIPYVFDDLGASNGFDPPPTDPALAAMISTYWVNFARTGDPNGPGLPYWPAFNDRSRRVMVFDAHPSARPLPNRHKLEALDRYFTWARQQERSPGQAQH